MKNFRILKMFSLNLYWKLEKKGAKFGPKLEKYQNPGEIFPRLGTAWESGEFPWIRDSSVHSGSSGTRTYKSWYLFRKYSITLNSYENIFSSKDFFKKVNISKT
jgi:hypothetical protein